MRSRLILAIASIAVLGVTACSGLPIPGASNPGGNASVCDALRNTANTGALGNRQSQENAVAAMKSRGCADIPTLP
jgi:hypothetical protein